jgi:alpha-glucan, water dikinase
MMLGCVGRGGNAQAVRDEILNIMHRNHIPEKNGTWMEQWHQKLVRRSTCMTTPSAC